MTLEQVHEIPIFGHHHRSFRSRRSEDLVIFDRCYLRIGLDRVDLEAECRGNPTRDAGES